MIPKLSGLRELVQELLDFISGFRREHQIDQTPAHGHLEHEVGNLWRQREIGWRWLDRLQKRLLFCVCDPRTVATTFHEYIQRALK